MTPKDYQCHSNEYGTHYSITKVKSVNKHVNVSQFSKRE